MNSHFDVIRYYNAGGLPRLHTVTEMPCQVLYCGEQTSWIPKDWRPFVIVSCAISLDGKLASMCGDTRLSSFEDKGEVHKLRSMVDAILVGINTVLHDNPHLTVSEKYYKSDRHPIRVVLDSTCKIPLDAEVITRRPEVKTIVAVTKRAPHDKISKLRELGVDVVVLGEDEVDLKQLLRYLREKYDVRVLMVEGGGLVIGSFFKMGLVDYLRLSISPILFGDNAISMVRGAIFCRVEDSPRFKLERIELCGFNVVLSFSVFYDS